MKKHVSPIIHYHVGALKTGTTYIQSRLQENRDNLDQAGINFIHGWEHTDSVRSYRSAVYHALDTPEIDEDRLHDAIVRLQGLASAQRRGKKRNSKLTLISAEYALGNYDIRCGLYPHARTGVEAIVKAFPKSTVRIFFALRSYARYMESSYLQRVFSRTETRSFDKFMANVNVDELSWRPAISAIQEIVGVSNLLIWPYEDFNKNEDQIWAKLLCRENCESVLPNPAQGTNPSLSGKGMEYKLAINRFANSIEDQKDREKFKRLANHSVVRGFIKRNFGVHAGLPAPQLLDAETRQRLESRYERDLEEIRRTSKVLT